MTRRRIWILSIFITLITMMLIAVEIVWIKVSRDSKNRDFEAAVSVSLDRVVDAIAHEETYTQVINQLADGGVMGKNGTGTSYLERQTSREGVRYTARSQELIPYNELESINQTKEIPYMNDSSVVEFLKKESADSLSVDSLNNPSHNVIDTRSVIVEQIVEQIYRIELPIEQRVTITQADTLIRNELKKMNVTATFEVAIVSENQNVLISTPEYFSASKYDTEVFNKQLFPNSPSSNENYYLKVFFPDKDFYIIQSLLELIVISFILTLLILTTFVTTLSIITRQKKKSEVRSAFVSNITHEFKTPIATISLAAQMLQDENIPATAKNVPYLSGMVSAQSKKLSFLVEQILQMSIFDKGDFELKTKRVDVHDVIHKVLSGFSLQIQGNSISVICKLEAYNPVIYVDELHYSNVITNLFDNALKYRKPDIIPSIEINTINKDNGTLVSFSDNGIGISKEYQKRVFEQFFRVPSGNVHDVKGFGLGLSYVKKIIEIMGGQIWLHSEPDKGSTFYVWMPSKK